MTATFKSRPPIPGMTVEEFIYLNPWPPVEVRRALVRYITLGQLPDDQRFAGYIANVGDLLKKLDDGHPWTDSIIRPFLDERR